MVLWRQINGDVDRQGEYRAICLGRWNGRVLQKHRHCEADCLAKNFIRGNATPLNDQFHFPNLTLKIDFFCCLDLLYEVGAWESVRGVAVDYLAGHGVRRCLRKGLSRARATFILGAKAEGWQLGESWRDAIAS